MVEKNLTDKIQGKAEAFLKELEVYVVRAQQEFDLHVKAGKAFSKKATIALFKKIANQLDKTQLTVGDVEKYLPKSEFDDVLTSGLTAKEYDALQEKRKKQKVSDFIKENLPAIDKGDEAVLKKFANQFGVNNLSEIPQAILSLQKRALQTALKETSQMVQKPLAHAEEGRLTERMDKRSKTKTAKGNSKSAVRVVYNRTENTL
jgi:predicted mannosyl-3-phosphoglycerate phosphatase (HAD superfamily)